MCDRNGPTKRCPPDSNGCLECGPGSALARATMECLFPKTTADDLPKYSSTGGGVIDPSPLDDPASSEWGKCFQSGLDNSMACAAVNCGPDKEPVFRNGKCVCEASNLNHLFELIAL